MDNLHVGLLSIAVVMLLIQSGMHIAVALMLTSFAGVMILRDYATAGKLLASSATTSIANDVFAVIPLFVLMGLVVSATGMGRDIFDVTARLTRRAKWWPTPSSLPAPAHQSPRPRFSPRSLRQR
jgi:C4-dicarboxylate transporter DctM subunit